MPHVRFTGVRKTMYTKAWIDQSRPGYLLPGQPQVRAPARRPSARAHEQTQHTQESHDLNSQPGERGQSGCLFIALCD